MVKTRWYEALGLMLLGAGIAGALMALTAWGILIWWSGGLQ